VDADDETWGFRKWEFDCLEAYAEQTNVGLRIVEIRAHGESFWFVPDAVENWEEERWEYSLRLWRPDDAGVEFQEDLKRWSYEGWRSGLALVLGGAEKEHLRPQKGIHFMFIISDVILLTDVDVVLQQKFSVRNDIGHSH